VKTLILFFIFFSPLWGIELNSTNDYNKALKQAQKENKKIYLLITSKYCMWSKKFKRSVLRNRRVIKKLNKKYIFVSLVKEKDFIPDRFNKKNVPIHYFLSNEGKIIYTYLGYWSYKDFSLYISDKK